MMRKKTMEPSVHSRLFCMKLLYWWYLFLSLLLFLVVFQVSCLGSDHWVRQGEGLLEWEGNLTRIIVGSEDLADKTYTELHKEFCSDVGDLNKAQCEAFQDMAEAGGIFIIYEVLSVVFTLVWGFRISLAVIRLSFLENWMAYVWPLLGFLCHILGCVFFIVVSGATFDNECEKLNDGDKRAPFCATSGPRIAIFLTLAYPMLAAGFIFIYWKSRKLAHRESGSSHSLVK